MKALHGGQHAQRPSSGWTHASERYVLAAVWITSLALALSLTSVRPVYADGGEEADVFLQLYHLQGGPCDDSWQQEFRRAHQSDPTVDDCLDRVWSLGVVRARGVAPTQDDWDRHYYLLQTEDEE